MTSSSYSCVFPKFYALLYNSFTEMRISQQKHSGWKNMYSDKRPLKTCYKVKYAMLAAYVAKLSLTTANEVPSLTIMLVTPTVLSV